MKILVTGGAGFIGSAFIRYWLRRYPKDQIVNLDKLTYAGSLASLQAVKDQGRYFFIKGDITDSRLVRRAMAGCETVVHFAAETHVDRSISGPAVFIRTNVIGTRVLLQEALRAKVKRFHHVSTDEVFGSLPLKSKKKFSEKTAYAPRSPYAASKAAADHLVRAWFFTYGLPITITNCSNNFGPFQQPEKLIPKAIVRILKNQTVPIYGDGLYVRDWLYVDDHCRAIELVLKKGKTGETYLVGGMGQEINNLQLIKLILKIMGRSQDLIEFVKDRPGHDRKYRVESKKIRRDLGWEPQAEFEKNLSKTIKWYQKNQQWCREQK
ncbi:MAG: dTDP-glucose 4,6-dehydratase [Candidatus Pacebacteria bacterium]|nr:dTDP-glucose 4,6-dehydratase [Candidatus Paceibacterota bacterium]